MVFESTASAWSSPSNQMQSICYKLSDRCLTSRTGAIGKDELNILSIPISGALFSEIDLYSYYNDSLLCIILREHKTRWHFGETHLTVEWWIISGLRSQPSPLLPVSRQKKAMCSYQIWGSDIINEAEKKECFVILTKPIFKELSLLLLYLAKRIRLSSEQGPVLFYKERQIITH